VDATVRTNRQDDWRNNTFKMKKVRNAIRAALDVAGAQVGVNAVTKAGLVHETPAVYTAQPSESLEELIDRVLSLVKNQHEY
jgi:beta-xylosidase